MGVLRVSVLDPGRLGLGDPRRCCFRSTISPAETAAKSDLRYSPPVMLGVEAAGLFWLILADTLDAGALFFPFLVSFTTQLAMIRSSRPLHAPQAPESGRYLLARNIAVSWAIYVIPYVLASGQRPERVDIPGRRPLFAAAWKRGSVARSAKQVRTVIATAPRWAIQSLCAGLASVLAFAAVQLA